jgi:hypothetical protein
MPGMERNGKIIVSVSLAGVGKQRFDVRRNGEALQGGKKKQKDRPPLISEKCPSS